MKQPHDPLDEFLKSKSRETEFEFREEYWEKAKKLIAEERRQKPSPNRIILFAGILFFFASVYMIAKVRSDYGSTTTTGTPNNVSSEHAITLNGKNTVDKTTNSKVNNTAAIPVMEQLNETKNNAPQVYPTFKNNLTETSENRFRETIQLSAKRKTTTVKSLKVGAVANQVSPANVINNEPELNTAVAETNNSKKQKTEKNTVTPEVLSETVAAIPRSGTTTVEPNTGIAESETASAEENNKKLLSFLEVEPLGHRQFFSTATVSSPVKKSPVKYPPSSYTYITLEAGMNYYNPSGSIANTADFHTGLRWHRYLSQRFTFSTGFGYGRLHQNHGTRTYNSYSYQFGEKVTSTRINTFRLDYLELPVNIHYRIKTRHSISAGLQFNYLLQSAELISKTGEQNSSKKDMGHFKAFSPFDIQSNVNYVVILPNRFIVTTGYYFGLMDITDNKSFKNTRYDRNSGFRLTLGYKLF